MEIRSILIERHSAFQIFPLGNSNLKSVYASEYLVLGRSYGNTLNLNCLDESCFKKCSCLLHENQSGVLIKTNSASEFESFPFHLCIVSHDWVWIHGTGTCLKPSVWFVSMYVSKFLQNLEIKEKIILYLGK